MTPAVEAESLPDRLHGGMTFDPVEHPRATDGTFTEKVGAVPEIALARDEGMGIIYTDLDVLQYAEDYYGEEWENAEDREAILAKRRDEYLTYRQTTDGLEEASRYYHFASARTSEMEASGEYDENRLPRTVRDNAISAAEQVRAEDADGIRSVYDLAVLATAEGDTELGDALYSTISDKLLINARTLEKDIDSGELVYNTYTVSQREKDRRDAEERVRRMANLAEPLPNLEYWDKVDWVMKRERTTPELAAVLLSESEDDLYRAVLSNQNIAKPLVEYAARSNSRAVQHAVVTHPKVTAAALREVQARVERDYLEATDPNNAWGTMKSYYDQSAAQAVNLMKDISDARGRIGA